MTALLHSLAAQNLMAATNPFDPMFDLAKQLALAGLAAILGVAAIVITAMGVWKLLKAIWNNPSLEKFLGIIGMSCAGAFFAAALPGLVMASWQAGATSGGTASAAAAVMPTPDLNVPQQGIAPVAPQAFGSEMAAGQGG